MKRSVIILFCFLSVQAAHSSIEVQGHRGARAVFPENTLKAFDYALRIGVDVLELDLGISRDGVVVVSHDRAIQPKICRYSDGRELEAPWPIVEKSWQELQQLDCGSIKNAKFPKQEVAPGEKLPRLEEVFELVRKSKHPSATTVRFNIETKIDPEHPSETVTPREFIKRIHAVLQRSGMQDRVMIQSFDPRTLVEARRQMPDIQTAFLVGDSGVDWVQAAQRFQVNVISPRYDLVTKSNIDSLHQLGVKVIPWTVNEEEDWKRLIQLGVDGLITDDPLALKSFLDRKS